VNAGNVFPDVRWLGKIPEILMSSTIDELERRGALRGKREGIRQGKREGKREGKLEIAAMIFRKRLGSSFAALEAPLVGCDDATLEQVVELAASNLSRRPLRARLAALLKG
jgi:predicted transposase YdaD